MDREGGGGFRRRLPGDAGEKKRNLDAVCFHAQQCVEKLMKALLGHLGLVPPKTHELLRLDGLLGPACAWWSWPADQLRFLGRAAVAFRYPGESADKEVAAEALSITRRMRKRLLELLGKSS